MQPVSTTIQGDGTRACLKPLLEQQFQAVKTEGEYSGDYSTLNSPLGDYHSHLQTEASEKKKKKSWKQVSLKVMSRHNYVDTQSFKEHLSNTCSVSGMCQAPGQQQSERQARSIPSRSLHSRRENAQPTKQ